jgi:hypothetical protein
MIVTTAADFHALPIEEAFRQLALSPLDPNLLDFSRNTFDETFITPFFRYLNARPETTADMLLGAELSRWILRVSWVVAVRQHHEMVRAQPRKKQWEAWVRFSEPAERVTDPAPPKRGKIGTPAGIARHVWENKSQVTSDFIADVLERGDERHVSRLGYRLSRLLLERFEGAGHAEPIALTVGHFRTLKTTRILEQGHPWEMLLGPL